jgi:hypothetical protein
MRYKYQWMIVGNGTDNTLNDAGWPTENELFYGVLTVKVCHWLTINILVEGTRLINMVLIFSKQNLLKWRSPLALS